MIILRQKTYSSETLKNLAFAGIVASPIVAIAIDRSFKKSRDRKEKEKIELKRIQQENSLREDLRKINPKLLIALDIENKIKQYLPKWGDGDEYPSFFVQTHYGDKEGFGNICLGFQNEEEYQWNKNKNCWEEIATERMPRRVGNLKQDILKNLSSYLKEWKSGNYGGDADEEDEKEVVVYLEKLIEEIKKSAL